MIPYIVFGAMLAAILLLLLWPLRQQRKFCAVTVIGMFAAALPAYHYFGAAPLLPLLEKHEQKMADARAVIAAESEKIKKEPKNLEAWIRLGQAFAISAQWPAAENAFKQSVLLSGGEPELIMAYVRAMIMGAEGNVSDHAKKSLEMVLLQKPDHAEAKYYMAVRQLQDGNTAQAMQEMKALYASLPADSPVKAMIDSQIGR